MSYFTDAVREYDSEVDITAARFVREGASPTEAMRRAQETVQRRRQSDATRTKSNNFAEMIEVARRGR